MAKLHDRILRLPEFTIPLDRVSQLVWITNQISGIMGEDRLYLDDIDSDAVTWLVADDMVMCLRWDQTTGSRWEGPAFSIGIDIGIDGGVVPEEMKSKVDKVFDYCEKSQWVKVDRAQLGVS